MKIFKKLSLLGMSVLLILLITDFKNHLLREYVSSKVVQISNYDENSGGTGFFVQLPSGKVGILTNAHVCKISKDQELFIKLDIGRKVPAHILEISQDTDLCLLDSYGETKGLSIGDAPVPGEVLYSIGHPALLPTSMTKGEYTGFGNIEILDHVLDSTNQNSCKEPRYHKKNIQNFLFQFEACTESFKVLYTTIPSFPGNSGSPIVDSYGKVRGICFAGSSQINWAILLSPELIKHFIEPY